MIQKAEKAELLEFFIANGQLGITEFTEYDKREVSNKGGVKLTVSGDREPHYISEKKIDSGVRTFINGSYVIASTDFDNSDIKKAQKDFLECEKTAKTSMINQYELHINIAKNKLAELLKCIETVNNLEKELNDAIAG